jgi:hypothetical protein
MPPDFAAAFRFDGQSGGVTESQLHLFTPAHRKSDCAEAQ